MYNSDRYLRRKYAAAVSQDTDERAENGPDERKPALAMAYIRDQSYGRTYPDQEALRKGTLFPELYMPYEGGSR